MKNEKIFVSFIGSRGAGKTTVANEFDFELKKRGYRVRRQHMGLSNGVSFKGLFNALILWFYFDAEIMKIIGFLGRSTRFLPSLYRIYLPLAFSKDLHSLRTKGEVLIYDSNFLRGMMQAYMNDEISLIEVLNFYERKILPHFDQIILVVVDTDPQTAISRWVSRDAILISEKQIENGIKDRVILQNVTELFAKQLSRNLKIKTIKIDGSKDPKTNANIIINYI